MAVVNNLISQGRILMKEMKKSRESIGGKKRVQQEVNKLILVNCQTGI
jgi:hypothetical protein